MKNVLYEADFELDFNLLIPVIMMIFSLAFPKIWKRSNENKYNNKSYKMVKLFSGCAFAIMLMFSLLTGITSWVSYENTVIAYKNGNYEIVEGYVENFVPMPYEGHSYESFEINGVKFSYSDYSITFGYNNAKSHGGVIDGNGQHLKLGYVNYNDENVIVYIEQLE